MMRRLARAALAAAARAGAEHADVRVGSARSERLAVRNGAVAALDRAVSRGLGVRAIARGAWGFAATSGWSEREATRAAREAVEIARASASVGGSRVRRVEEPPHRARWASPLVLDPFRVPLAEKLGLLYAADRVLRAGRLVRAALASMEFRRRHELFASSEGAEIEQTWTTSGAGLSATAADGKDSQVRSYPASFGGQFQELGYEMVLGLDLAGNAERVREEAIALLSAPACPERTTDLVLSGSQLALQIHESVGHPTELDRVLGQEANYAGTSFATTEKLGRLRYGSRLVNLVADNTVPAGLATRGFDDDGVAMQKWDIVREGVFVGYGSNRETARAIGETRSRGCNRAEGPLAVPITRIPNLSLMPGEGKLEEIVADTRRGIWMDVNRLWSIDQRRLNFQFGCELAREIRNGRLGRLYKNPTYQGITPEFWRSCDAVAGSDEWVLWGVANCGKGQPGQRSEMSHGAAPARFRNVRVGVRA